MYTCTSCSVAAEAYSENKFLQDAYKLHVFVIFEKVQERYESTFSKKKFSTHQHSVFALSSLYPVLGYPLHHEILE